MKSRLFSRTLILCILLLQVALCQPVQRGQLADWAEGWRKEHLRKAGVKFDYLTVASSDADTSSKTVVDFHIWLSGDLARRSHEVGNQLSNEALHDLHQKLPAVGATAGVVFWTNDRVIGRAPADEGSAKTWITSWLSLHPSPDVKFEEVSLSGGSFRIVLRDLGPTAKASSAKMLRSWKEAWPYKVTVEWSTK